MNGRSFTVIIATVNIIIAMVNYFTGDMQKALWHLGLTILLMQLEGRK